MRVFSDPGFICDTPCITQSIRIGKFRQAGNKTSGYKQSQCSAQKNQHSSSIINGSGFFFFNFNLEPQVKSCFVSVKRNSGNRNAHT